MRGKRLHSRSLSPGNEKSRLDSGRIVRDSVRQSEMTEERPRVSLFVGARRTKSMAYSPLRYCNSTDPFSETKCEFPLAGYESAYPPGERFSRGYRGKLVEGRIRFGVSILSSSPSLGCAAHCRRHCLDDFKAFVAKASKGLLPLTKAPFHSSRGISKVGGLLSRRLHVTIFP